MFLQSPANSAAIAIAKTTAIEKKTIERIFPFFALLFSSL